jgi:hypothetical protein
MEHLQYFHLSHLLEAAVVAHGTIIHQQNLKQEKLEDQAVVAEVTLLQEDFQEEQETLPQQHHLKDKLELQELLQEQLAEIIMEPEEVVEEPQQQDQEQLEGTELLQIGHHQT